MFFPRPSSLLYLGLSELNSSHSQSDHDLAHHPVGPLLDLYVATMVVCPSLGRQVLSGHLEYGHAIYGQWLSVLFQLVKTMSPTIGIVGIVAGVS